MYTHPIQLEIYSTRLLFLNLHAFLHCDVTSCMLSVLWRPQRWCIMAGWREIQKQKVSEAHAGTEDISSSATGLRRLRQFPKATKNLLFNPTFMFISLAGAAESVWNIILIGDTLHDMTGCNSSYATCSYMYFITISGVLVSGVATFLPKYLESQFSLKSSIAAIYIGMKLSCSRQLCIG